MKDVRALLVAPLLAACLAVAPEGPDGGARDAAPDATSGAGGAGGASDGGATGECTYPLEAGSSSEVGSPLRIFDFRTCDDQPLNTRAYACTGKVFLFDVSANWCSVCRSQMPELQSLHDRFAAQGLRVLVVTVADRYNDAPTAADCAWWRDNATSAPLTFAVAYDPTRAAGALVQEHVPVTILTDRGGIVRYRREYAGATDLEAHVEALLAE